MNHIFGFFSNLLGPKHDSGLSFSSDFWDVGTKISSDENADLMVPLFDEEIGR